MRTGIVHNRLLGLVYVLRSVSSKPFPLSLALSILLLLIAFFFHLCPLRFFSWPVSKKSISKLLACVREGQKRCGNEKENKGLSAYGLDSCSRLPENNSKLIWRNLGAAGPGWEY